MEQFSGICKMMINCVWPRTKSHTSFHLAAVICLLDFKNKKNKQMFTESRIN